MKRFLTVQRMVYVITILLVCRAWLYRQYFALHGGNIASRLIEYSLVIFLTIYIVVMVRAHKSRQMVTGGVFRIIAHPAYALYVALDIPLWFLVDKSPFMVITGVLLYLALVVGAYGEEKSMMKLCGDKARKYYQKTLSVHFVLWRAGVRS